MKFSKQYPKLAFSVTRPPSVTPSNSFSQRTLSCFAALFSLRGKLSRAYPVCLTYSPILINMFNMLQFTLSFLSLLLLLVLLACFFTVLRLPFPHFLLPCHFHSILAPFYCVNMFLSVARSFFRFNSFSFTLLLRVSSLLLFHMFLRPSFRVFCLCVCSFFASFCLFVSISYICLLAKFIRFSFRFLFSMFASPLDSLISPLLLFFRYSTTHSHNRSLSPSRSSKFIHNKVYRPHCFSLFSLLLNLGTFPSVRKVDSHALTLTLYFHVFNFCCLTHTYAQFQRNAGIAWLCRCCLLLLVVSCFFLVLFKLIYLNELFFRPSPFSSLRQLLFICAFRSDILHVSFSF